MRRKEMEREGTDRGRLVKITAGDGHELDGILYEADESLATVLHVHGSLGNFYHQRFITVFARALTREGINLLSCNMRAHDGIAEGYDTEGEMKYVGGSLARFETCVEDIKGAVAWSRRMGRQVYLQGHSLGCDRVLHYLESTRAGLSPILLSPCDSRQLQRDWLGEEQFSQQEAALRERNEVQSTAEVNTWALSPRETYGLKGGDGWTYAIPVTEEVLESILLGPVGRLLAIEKGGYASQQSGCPSLSGPRRPYSRGEHGGHEGTYKSIAAKRDTDRRSGRPQFGRMRRGDSEESCRVDQRKGT